MPKESFSIHTIDSGGVARTGMVMEDTQRRQNCTSSLDCQGPLSQGPSETLLQARLGRRWLDVIDLLTVGPIPRGLPNTMA